MNVSGNWVLQGYMRVNKSCTGHCYRGVAVFLHIPRHIAWEWERVKSGT